MGLHYTAIHTPYHTNILFTNQIAVYFDELKVNDPFDVTEFKISCSLLFISFQIIENQLL